MLTSRYQDFAAYIFSLSDTDFMFAANGKWTAGQQFDHIYRSVSPLALGLKLPKFLLKMLWGKANRPSKDYDALVKKYQGKLESGGKATAQFIPKNILLKDRNVLKKKVLRAIEVICKSLNRYTEEELDTFIAPHPLLGKITLREMMYFTIYHVEHHHKLTIKHLVKQN